MNATPNEEVALVTGAGQGIGRVIESDTLPLPGFTRSIVLRFRRRKTSYSYI